METMLIHELIAEQAKTRPDSVAVVHGNEEMTYAELTRRVHSLAWSLREDHGVGPDTLVPVLFERSFDMVVGLLAVIAAGGACVPLDPRHPVARMRFIIGDSGANLLLTNLDADPSLAPLVDVVDLRQDPTWPTRDGMPPRKADDSLIYCLYTSGSTGEPKGVLVEHRGVLNVLRWAQDYFPISPDDRVLQKTTYTFDISITELYLPLISGACLVLPPVGAEQSPVAIRKAVVRHGVTIIQFVPSGLASYLALMDEEPLPGVKHCVCAGESLKPSLRTAFYTATSGCQLHNLYGPTETSVYATGCPVEPGDAPVTVGGPLANTTLYILDDAGRLCPPGVVGELCIAGAGLARGYLNRPEQTAEKFVDAPFSPGERMYRTGDLAIWLESGEVDLVGRRDHQVKIRGYRIELGEVERALAALDGVRDGAVIAADINGQNELVAYWVGSEDVTIAALREGLREALPAYMVPARFIRLDAFPLTSSGKMKRSALPAPDLDADSGNVYEAPRDPLGQGLASIFQEVLGWGQVGVHDRFLDLGGDSLKAVRVVQFARQRLARDLEIELLLRNDSLGELAAKLDVASVGALPAIEPAPPAEWHPISSGQLLMWLLAEAGAPHAAYAVPAVYELKGSVDSGALGRSVELLVSRHESLRTAIKEVDGVPMQRVVENHSLDWRTVTITDAADVDRTIGDFVALDFDLPAGQVIRALLIERSATDYVFVVTVHHIASDGWSLNVQIEEIASVYRSFAAGEQPSLPAATLQYKDYAYWQQGLADQPSFEDSRKYWLGKLGGDLEPLDLPADRARPASRTFRGAVIRRTIPGASLEAFKTLCRDQRSTLYAGVGAVLRVLFFRYTGQRDFVLGTSALGRPVPELDNQIGYYVNTVALRDTVEPGMRFRDVLRAGQTTLIDGVRHSGYPFDQVVRDLGAGTDPSHNPLFDVMLMMDPGWGAPSVEVDGLEIRQLDAPTAHSKMDFTFFFKETESGLKTTVEYSTDICDADRVNRMLEHLEILLTAVVATPDVTVEKLTLLPADDRHQVLVGFNDTGTEYELETPIHHLFERQVQRTPDRVATVDDNQELTFAQLNAKANTLAWRLRDDYGVVPGTLVALLLDRSVDMTVSVLGVLKAGGAYLPISGTDPAERIDTILDDSGSGIVLTQGSQPGELLREGRHFIDIGSLSGRDGKRDDNPPPAATPDDISYCIYTSGSTGKPNGVLVEHRGVINRLRWMIDDLGLDENDVILQKTPYVFDVSVWELLLPGMIGAKQVMLRHNGQSDPATVREAIERHAVTTLHFVPSMLSQYLAAVEDGFPSVRHCVCSGEELSRDLAQKFFAATRETMLHNYYGPTEATVDVSLVCVQDSPEPVTLGRPAPNTRLYVLSDSDEPAPIGVPGELCIAGLQVARGYLNRPEMNAKRFTADPFRPGQRMYRTGDLACWLPNGEIRYLGRRDKQVKVRGFRIELGEIEQALRDLDGVEDAVVIPRADFLYAYVAGPACPPAGELRASLASRLPDYMLPSHYVRTDAIPVTRNGKADRKALVALAGAQVAAREYVAPRTPVEEDLAGIWQSLLAGRVGVTDDFFVVGGNSLSALQLSSRISRAFDIPMRVASIFSHRTVADQAGLIADFSATPASGVLQPVQREARHVLSFAQERMWFLHMLDPNSGMYNIRVLAKLSGDLDAEVLRAAVDSLVARHEMLRTTIVNEGDRVYQAPHADRRVTVEIRDFTATDPDVARETVRQEVRQVSSGPFRLEEELALRVVLFRLGATEHQLLVVLHHIAGDGWSLRLMMRELSALYTRHLGEPTTEPTTEPATLPELPVQYIDYAEAVRHPDREAAIDSDLRYWVARLTGTPPLELPTDVPEADGPSIGEVSTMVSAQTCGKLRDLAARTATTSFEITMSALNLVLSRLSDQQDLVVGFPMANRQSVETEGIVGLFLNTLVLRTDLTGAPSFTELLRRVSEGVREAYEHQAAPFELVVERLNPVRRLDRDPVFDVQLNYLGDMREEISIKGVTIEIDENDFDIEAKFPLSFYVRDEGDGMLVTLSYRPDLISAARAESIVRQLRLVLDQVAKAPDATIASYSLVDPGMTSAELGRALDEPEYPPVTELIAQRASAAPDSVAIAQGTASITYGELVQRAEAVARQLVSRGHGAGDVIGVTGPRGIGFVVGMLGVLRSGATVFPVDPDLPEGRRRHLLEIGEPRMFVRSGETDEAGDNPISLDDATGLPLAPSPETDTTGTALSPVSARSPAYLFFTSGTTGTPRGVHGWHGALSHFLLWQSRTFGITAGDRCAQTTSVSFDVMLRDTFLALVSGGTMVAPEPSDMLGGRALFRWVERERITVLHAVPAVMRSWLLDAPEGQRLAHLRLMFLAGEPLKASLVESVRSRYPDTRLVNLYGPTETTMAKFAYPVPDGPLPAVLPVGSPLPQTEAVVMRDGVVCGVGEPGEIVIRTPFRSLGYLGDPAATNASFVHNPHRDDSHDLLYHTGDLGRFRPDGLLEIVGRQDHQIKISGVRIQPAEVENALGGHPSVSHCLVMAHKDPQGEAHLIAYVVANEPVDRLRSYLTDRLPQAMVPSEFIVLDRIPTTPNGKPDRRALPAPSFTRIEPRVASAEPGTDTERAIRDVWATVLDRPVLGVDDNFFELGGTSLKLLRLYARLQDRYPNTFRVAQLFTYPTITTQAALVEPRQTQSTDEVIEHEF